MSVLSLAALCVLLWLGQWQYSRYSEKLSGGVAAQMPVSEHLVTLNDTGAPAQWVYGIVDGESVWRRYVFGTRTADGAGVLVMTGARGGINPPPDAEPVSGRRSVTGRVFERPNSRASARNRPDKGIWYVFDAAGIAAALGFPPEHLAVVEPVEIEIRSVEDPSRVRVAANPYAASKPVDPLPPQRHLGYALTWWGLAAALIGVYLAFHRARGRLSFGKSQ